MRFVDFRLCARSVCMTIDKNSAPKTAGSGCDSGCVHISGALMFNTLARRCTEWRVVARAMVAIGNPPRPCQVEVIRPLGTAGAASRASRRSSPHLEARIRQTQTVRAQLLMAAGALAALVASVRL